MSAGQVHRRWEVEQTRALVHACFGPSQLSLLRPSLRAVDYRLAHAKYHFKEWLRLVAAHIDGDLELGRDIWDIGFPCSDSEIQAHNLFFIGCEAHLYACVQAIHAVADNMAHVVHYGMGLNLNKALAARDVSLNSLVAYMCKARPYDPSLSILADLLSDLKEADAFKLLCDISNQFKHHGGPSVSLALAPSSEQPYEIRFGHFLRGNKWHLENAADDLLGEAFRVVNVAVVDVGIALNTWLRSSAPENASV